MAEDLEKLKDEITALGEKIRTLKTSASVEDGNTADAVAAAVQELTALKKKYADNNNGIGVDGKPYQEQLSKAEKKAKAKAEKEGGVSGKQESDPNSVNAQKKAAKKAAKKEAKTAHKAEGSAAAPDNKEESKGPAVNTNKPVAGKPAVPTPAAAVAAAKPISAFPVAAPVSGGGPEPLQVVINPNLPLTQRPIVALSVACLTNTDVDLEIIADHKSRHTAMGMEEGGTVAGDFAMARYLARRASAEQLLPSQSPSAAVVEAWVDYAQSLSLLGFEQRVNAVTLTLQHALADRTYLVGHAITMADLCLFAAAGFPNQAADLRTTLQAMPSEAHHARRWMEMMASHPALQQATQLCVGIASNVEAVFDESNPLEPLVPGMCTLEGAVAGRIVTRFPPEPSGYLHIGHAKAVLLNDYYARRYKGRLIVRFDDTNPSKEKEEYQESIVQDLAKLGVKPDVVSYTSDYFDSIQAHAEYLIEKGLAFMDDTPQEQMQAERLERQESKHRNQSPADALKYFKLMCSGSAEGSTWCLRAKIDMKSDNGTLRDPVIYRQNLTPHHRCGTRFKAYPTYDLACPIVDSVEGVTHALRTTEYNDRDQQYQWLLKALGLRRVRIHAFSRVNFKNTVLSKRKLTWFVDNNYVTGWDDPRMPTIRGVIRRGVNVSNLRNFMYSQGASRRVVLMDWMVFWSENKKEIDKTAKRFMAIDKEDHVKLSVTNAPKEQDYSFVPTSMHPKDPSVGTRAVRISSDVLLETIDVEGIMVGEEIVLMRWGVVRITKVDLENKMLEGEFIPDGDFKSCKRKLSWIANVQETARVILTEFDNLVSKDKLEEEDNFMDFINPNTKATTEVIGDAGLKNLQEHEVIQLERRGFYRVDRPYINKEKPLILYMIPDGKSKAMAGIKGKLAHR